MPKFARRLGWRSLRNVVDGNRSRPPVFWRQLAKDLAYAMAETDIWKPIQAAHFVAQLAHESAGFRFTEEIWGPTPAQQSYDGRMGNRHGTDDWSRYRGRSYIQITGRDNYRALPHWDEIDFLKRPERLAERKYAAKGAARWWKAHGLNDISLHGDPATVEAVTRRINGGVNGLAERRRYFDRAYKARRFLTPSRRPPS